MTEARHMIILSLGAGVQSSTLALMAAHGDITPMPDAAIFADTQGEPSAVYRWLDWLEPQLPFPVHRVTAGDLAADFLRALESPDSRCGQPPFYVRAENGAAGMLRRKCTSEYKISPIRRRVRQLSGGQPVTQWIGISLDEAHRMKPSGVRYVTHAYPLIDARMTRHDCLQWLARHDYPAPPKSACIFCPYADKRRLRELRDGGDDWRRLVAFDARIRELQNDRINGANIHGEIFITRDMVPISELDLSTPADNGQRDLFGDECEGMCGV